jgi:hypothetical protein
MSEYVSTPESFGTVALHSDELGAAMDEIVLPPAPPGKPYKLSPDEKYLCKAMLTKLPFLPVVHREERKLFIQMLICQQGTLEFDKMAIDWCKHVDGINIFSKLPVYLQRHFSKYLHSQQVRDAVANATTGEAKLRQLNEQLCAEELMYERNTKIDTDNPNLYVMPPITMPPTMSQIPDTLLLPGRGVSVAGTIIGGAQPTRRFKKQTINNQGNDKSGQKIILAL